MLNLSPGYYPLTINIKKGDIKSNYMDGFSYRVLYVYSIIIEISVFLMLPLSNNKIKINALWYDFNIVYFRLSRKTLN